MILNQEIILNNNRFFLKKTFVTIQPLYEKSTNTKKLLFEMPKMKVKVKGRTEALSMKWNRKQILNSRHQGDAINWSIKSKIHFISFTDSQILKRYKHISFRWSVKVRTFIVGTILTHHLTFLWI